MRERDLGYTLGPQDCHRPAPLPSLPLLTDPPVRRTLSGPQPWCTLEPNSSSTVYKQS